MDSKTLIKMLEERGWREVRKESTHRTYKHPTIREIITVQHPRKDIPKGTLRSIEKIAGLR